jgi:hypothetical protein
MVGSVQGPEHGHQPWLGEDEGRFVVHPDLHLAAGALEYRNLWS